MTAFIVFRKKILKEAILSGIKGQIDGAAIKIKLYEKRNIR